jgi:eukaryotic-like serine/threonine-protein kinase
LQMRASVGDSLRRAGGHRLFLDLVAAGQQALGTCLLTGPGKLPVRGIIHSVSAWNEVSCITRATHRALLLAEEHKFERLALPALGTGRGRVAIESCIDSMVGVLRLHLLMGHSPLKEVRFVLFDRDQFETAVQVARGILLQESDPTEALD